MSIFCRDFIVMLLNKFLRCVQANILCIYIYIYNGCKLVSKKITENFCIIQNKPYVRKYVHGYGIYASFHAH